MEDKTQILYQKLYDNGLYTKTYDDFKVKWGSPEKITELHGILTQKGLYTKSIDEFNEQYFPQKKKDFAVGQVSATVSQKPQEPLEPSTTPQLPSEPTLTLKTPELGFKEVTPQIQTEKYLKGEEIPRAPYEAKSFMQYLTSFGGFTAEALSEVARLGDWVQTTASEALIQTLAGKEIASEIAKLRKEGVDVLAMNSPRVLDGIADAIDWWVKGEYRPMPEKTPTQRVIAGISKGTANVIPSIIFSQLGAPIKAGQLLSKAGFKSLSRFGTVLGAESTITGAQRAEEGTVGQKLTLPIIDGIEGFLSGAMYDGFSEMASKIGLKIANKIIPYAKTSTQAIDKALLQQGASTASNVTFFGSYGALDEFIKTGKVSAENVATNTGMAIAFSGRDIGKLLFTKGLTSLVGTPREVINKVVESKSSVEELTKQAQEWTDAVDEGTTQNRTGALIMSFMLVKTAQLKAVTDEVKDNPVEVIKSVNESTLEKGAKELIIDKINEIDADNDPKIQETRDINVKIAKIDEALQRIRDNKSWDETRKEVESAPLKERKLELKEEASSIYGVKPKEKGEGEKEKPKVLQTELSKKTLDEINKPKLEEEMKNAIQRSTGSSEVSQEGGTEKGVETVEGVFLRDGGVDQGKTQGETRTGEELNRLTKDDFTVDGGLTDDGFKKLNNSLVSIITDVANKTGIPIKPLLKHFNINDKGEYFTSIKSLLQVGESTNFNELIETVKKIAVEMNPKESEKIINTVNKIKGDWLNALESGDKSFVIPKEIITIYDAIDEINNRFIEVKKPQEFTEREQEQIIEQKVNEYEGKRGEITPKEAISAPITEEKGVVPPEPPKVVETLERGQKEGSEQYTLGIRALNSPKLDQDIKDAIQKEGINYEPRGRKVRAEEAQEIVNLFSKEEGGLDKIESMVYNTKNDIPNDTRTFLNVYLADQYNTLKNNATELAEKDRLRQKVVDLYMFGMEQGKLGGQHVEAQKEWSKVFGNSPEMVSALIRNHIERKNRSFFQSKEEELTAAKKLLDDVFGSPEGKARIEQEVSEEISKIGTKNFGKESKKKIDDFFNGLLIDPKQQNLYGGLLGIPVAAWNGSVLAVKNAVLLGMDIATAIQRGAEYLDKWYKDEFTKGKITSPDWNRTEYEAHMKDKFSGLKKEIPISEKPTRKKPPKVKVPPTQEEMVNKLLEKMAGFATRKQLQNFMKSYMQEFQEKGMIGDQRFKDLLAKALGMDYVSDATEAKLTQSAQTLGYAQKKIKEVIDAFDELEKVQPNTKEFDELRKKLKDLKKEADKASFNAQKANQYIKTLLTDEPELWDKIGTLIQGNLLVPTSIIRNIYGNFFMAPARATHYLAMNTMDIILSQTGIARNILRQNIDPVKHPDWYRWAMKLPTTQRTVDMMASFRGFREGVWAGLKEGVRQIKTGQLEDDYRKKEIQRGLEPIKALIRLKDSLTGKEKRKFDKLIGDVLEALPSGYMGEAMFRLLNLGDKPFRRAAETARLSEIAEIKGLKGVQREKFLNNPDNESLAEAQKVGDFAVYTNDNIVSKLIEYANRSLAKGQKSNSEAIKSTSTIAKVLFKLGKATTLPYVRTPVNLAIEAFEYAVPTYSLARAMESTYRGNRREALDYFGKAIVGTMVSSLAVSLIKNGIMTPASSEEDKLKQAEFAGKEGYRLNLDAFHRWLKGDSTGWQDGDNTVTLKGYGTMSMIMMAYGAAYKDKTTEEIEQESAPERWATVFGSVITSSLEQSIMTGVNTALQAALKGEKERDRWLINTATAMSTAVYPSTLASISKTFSDENYLRETRDLSKEEGQLKTQMVNTFKDRMFMGKDLPTKVSIWGEQVKMIPDGNTWTYNLLGVSKNKKYQKYSFGTKMFELYEEYKKTNPDEAKMIFPSLPSPATKVGWDDSRMTPIQLQNYQIRVGELRAEYAENYVNSEEFKDASIEDRTQKLTSMYSKARQIADSEMFRWSGFEEKNPEKWLIISSNDAIPIPSAIKVIKSGNKEFKLDNTDVELLNNIALAKYAERIIPFLETSKDNMINLKKVNEKTGKSRFIDRTNDLWRSSIDYAKRQMLQILREKE